LKKKGKKRNNMHILFCALLGLLPGPPTVKIAGSRASLFAIEAEHK
jgi:hypothetical protein